LAFLFGEQQAAVSSRFVNSGWILRHTLVTLNAWQHGPVGMMVNL
jgi:hypothetical protein